MEKEVTKEEHIAAQETSAESKPAQPQEAGQPKGKQASKKGAGKQPSDKPQQEKKEKPQKEQKPKDPNQQNQKPQQEKKEKPAQQQKPKELKAPADEPSFLQVQLMKAVVEKLFNFFEGKITQAQISAAIIPPKKKVADYAIPAFFFARTLQGKKPEDIAKDVAEKLKADPVEGVTVVNDGPYINFTLQPTFVARTLLPQLLADPLTHTVRSETGKGKTVCIDFSSPNIAKHLALHHIRSTMIGNALFHLYSAGGWKVVRINFLGDWGTAFGRLIAGWKRKNLTLDDLNKAPNKVTFLNELYVEISKLSKLDSAVMEEARFWSKKLEDGDQEARGLWTLFKEASLAEFERVYSLLGVGFDSWKGEAYYEDKMGPVLQELTEKNLVSTDKGALVVELKSVGLDKPCMLKRADGGSLYATRDLASADDRWNEFKFDRAVYVVDAGQSLHFTEWFAVAKLLGRPYVDTLRHIKFGVMLMKDEESGGWEKTASRKGAPMLLMDFLQESIARAKKIMIEKNPEIAADSPEADLLAQKVGVGAVVFNDLKNSRQNDVKFQFEEALRMDGFTGPYVQFTHARLCSIMRKFEALYPNPVEPDFSLITRNDEKEIILLLIRFQKVLERSIEVDEPSQFCTHILNLSAALSTWLTAGNTDKTARVLNEDPKLASARLALVKVCRIILAEALRLIGLHAPEKM